MPETVEVSTKGAENRASRWKALHTPLYLLALLASISSWLVAIRAPLWQDEYGTYWQISAGFTHIWSRQFNIFPAYFYLIWLWTRLFGPSEIALRSPSVLAMLGAVWLLRLIAHELFNGNRGAAFATAVAFCIQPITIFEAIDIRPYAFTALAGCLSIWFLLRLRNSASLRLAALFGASAALAVWFHYLSVVLAPALLILFFAFKWQDRRNLWRQLAIALTTFTLTFLPLIPGVLHLLHTSQMHNWKVPTTYLQLILTVFPILLDVVLLGIALVALILDTFATIRPGRDDPQFGTRPLAVAALLGLIPLLLLFMVSRWTGLNCFEPRYRLIALPGIALCFGWVIGQLRPSILRLVFCLIVAAITASLYFLSPNFHQHNGTWKYALQAVEAKAALTRSPVLMCSGYVESDFWPLPSGPANNTLLLAQLSYYKLTVPAYVLPMELNAKAKQIGSAFISRAAESHHRFFAVCGSFTYPVFPTLDWLSHRAAADFSVTTVGTYSGIRVLEFTPRPTLPKKGTSR